MALKLNRSRIFLIGLLIILIYIVLSRVDYIIGNSTTQGVVTKTRNYESIIKFSIDSEEITFHGTTITPLEMGDKMSVIYKIKNPKNANIYSFGRFWFMPIIYSLFPLMVVTAATLAFLTPSDIISIRYEKRKLNVTKTTLPYSNK